MPIPNVTPLPPHPQRDDPDFADKAGVWVEALATVYTPELNDFAPALVAAAASANYSSLSTTSREIGLGTKTFEIEAGKMFVAGQYVKISSGANPLVDWLWGVVNGYDFVTGWISVEVQRVGPAAAGIHTDWIIGLSGPVGPTGDPQDSGIDVQEFLSSGTWTKPANARFVLIEAWGGGGGGAGGESRSGGEMALGGGGGGGGGYAWRLYRATALSATETVIIGAGGTPGASRNTAGNAIPGSPGGATSVGGSPLRIWAGGGAGGVGGGGNNVPGARGGGVIYDGSIVGRPIYAPATGEVEGHFGSGYYEGSVNDRHGAASAMGGGQGAGSGSSAATALYGGTSAMGGAGGGAGGGARGSTPAAVPGGNGGGNGLNQGGGSGGATGNPGADGTAGTVARTGGGGGGGSAGTGARTGGNGGAGAAPGGGGGGGGGASSNGATSTSGAGGNGAAGMVRITTWFDA